ncbi:hypothetical protein Dxin01_00758 [Deinococcus xinjiangensis]|uniref:Uncharacterized protein n=1 Tax=Deinococcus xinjiangensis TaxID=457454 RepID=A0ABP9V6Y8_9DEIO
MPFSSATLNRLLVQILTSQMGVWSEVARLQPVSTPDFTNGEGWDTLAEVFQQRGWLGELEQRFGGQPLSCLNTPDLRVAVLHAFITLADPERRCNQLERRSLESLGFRRVGLPFSALLRHVKTEAQSLGPVYLLQLFASPYIGEDQAQRSVLLLPTYLEREELQTALTLFKKWQRDGLILEMAPFTPARRLAVVYL